MFVSVVLSLCLVVSFEYDCEFKCGCGFVCGFEF